MQNLELGPDHVLTTEEVYRVATGLVPQVSLSGDALDAIDRSRKVVENLIENGEVVYGITTGFGMFKDVYVEPEKAAQLQTNLIRSHAVGVGGELSSEVIRGALLARVNSLAKGYSGIRRQLAETALALLNADICPVVPSQGSVGASGDLAPLSHMGLALMGEGEVRHRGARMPSRDALAAEGIEPITFTAKEGLAWNNGTSVMLSTLSLALYRAEYLADIADIACAMTLEAVQGTGNAFRAQIHQVRPHAGQSISAQRIRNVVKGSKLVDAVPGRVQDAYSIRCAPQVHGASRDALTYVRSVVDIELNSVTDNPIVFPDTGEILSGGNFHGEPLAQAADTLAIAVSEFGAISERRTARLVDSHTNEGLPLFLIPTESAGFHSGLMMPQYTAAALASENKSLSHPASVDSIPTSANQEDHVSMGSIATRKALKVVEHVESILAIELLTAVQAVEFRGPDLLAPKTRAVYDLVRAAMPFVAEDRALYLDIEAVRGAMLGESMAGLASE
jgi:histidine ammonia-lyase